MKKKKRSVGRPAKDTKRLNLRVPTEVYDEVVEVIKKMRDGR